MSQGAPGPTWQSPGGLLIFQNYPLNKALIMKLSAVMVLVLTASGPLLAAECINPEAPSLPKGAKASMEQMLDGQKAVKAFQSANIEYMNCLEKQFMDAEARAKEGTEDERAAAQAEYANALEAYNTAVSREESVAGQFNTEIRAYKEANPK